MDSETSDLTTIPAPAPRRATLELFSLAGRVVLVTGGAGLLGTRHARAVVEAGGTAVLADVCHERARSVADELGRRAQALHLDVTDEASVERALAVVLDRHGRIDVLVNNAAVDPKAGGAALASGRLEAFPLARWHEELAVGLTGAFLCARVFGTHMAAAGGGSIVNIASDLAIVAPDQRLYQIDGLPPSEQPVKPVTYSVLKSGLLGLTRYLATYWADRGVRVNALCPGGVANGQPEEFVARLIDRIPLGRMAHRDEYMGALVFLCSDASSYMTGATLVVDGGRTCW
ncbi:MAG: SDR family oxidoreductase [Polyangiaceae bacterium]|nr:SDR family oxidoreductase [Polyangiaceae bacterium]